MRNGDFGAMQLEHSSGRPGEASTGRRFGVAKAHSWSFAFARRPATSGKRLQPHFARVLLVVHWRQAALDALVVNFLDAIAHNAGDRILQMSLYRTQESFE